MAKLTQTDVDALIKEMNAAYQPANGKCRATPEAMNLLLNHLAAYTNEVSDEAQDEGLSEDTNVAQWAVDMANWQQRMAHYKAELVKVPKTQWATDKGCKAIYRNVTAPLLSGVYWEVLPGIVLSSEEKARIIMGGESNRKPPDVATVFSLGNQVVVYREHQAERARKFWEDLEAQFKKLLKGVKGIGTDFLLPLGLVLAGGVGVYLIVQQRKKMQKAA